MSADVAVVGLPSGPVPPCTWFVDALCDADAVAMVETDNHRSGACGVHVRLVLARAAEAGATVRTTPTGRPTGDEEAWARAAAAEEAWG